MKKTTRVISSILLLMILFYTLPIYAYANNKTIYTKLNSDGKVYKEIISTKENEEVNQKESGEPSCLMYAGFFFVNEIKKGGASRWGKAAADVISQLCVRCREVSVRDPVRADCP